MNENKQYVSKINGYYIKDGEARESITSKADSSTTLAGYGITDAYTKSEVDTSLGGKADSSTTLAGYGITDAYTKTEVDNALMNLPNICVLSDTQTLTEMDVSDTNYKQTVWTINYPTGFNKDNTYVLSFGGKLSLSGNLNAYGVANTSSGMLTGASLPRQITLVDENIRIAVWNPSTSELTYTFKLLLMRVDPEENNGGE